MTETTQGYPDLLSVNEVANIFRVDPTTARRWIKLGVLEAFSLPHKGEREVYRIRRETVEKMLGKSLS